MKRPPSINLRNLCFAINAITSAWIGSISSMTKQTELASWNQLIDSDIINTCFRTFSSHVMLIWDSVVWMRVIVVAVLLHCCRLVAVMMAAQAMRSSRCFCEHRASLRLNQSEQPVTKVGQGRLEMSQLELFRHLVMLSYHTISFQRGARRTLPSCCI